MAVSQINSSDVHEEVRRKLADTDVRYTGGRQAVIKALQRVNGPQSAADLHKRIKSVPLSSLYRSLTVLDEAGVLRKHHDADGLARFELAEWITGHHHHVVCVECGIVEDVELDKKAEKMLDQLAEKLADAAGYRLDGHVLEVEGVCGSCRG
jgi:Fur family transcriptional regulator, ferric uptake regulator